MFYYASVLKNYKIFFVTNQLYVNKEINLFFKNVYLHRFFHHLHI